MNKKTILIYGLIALIIIVILIFFVFVINKYKSIPVRTYNIDNSIVKDETDAGINKEENFDNNTIDNKNQNIDIDNNVNDNNNKPSNSGSNSNNKNNSSTSTTTKPEDTDFSDDVVSDEEQHPPIEESDDNYSESVKFYTSWGMETTAPKYASMDTCIQAGEEIRLTSKLEDGFYEIGQIGCTEIYDSKKSSRNLLGYNIIELICVDYVYDDDGTRTQINYDCTDKYLK